MQEVPEGSIGRESEMSQINPAEWLCPACGLPLVMHPPNNDCTLIRETELRTLGVPETAIDNWKQQAKGV